MYVARDAQATAWERIQPTGTHNTFESVRDVEYTESDLVGRDEQGPVFIFHIGPTEWGEFLIVGVSGVKIIDE